MLSIKSLLPFFTLWLAARQSVSCLLWTAAGMLTIPLFVGLICFIKVQLHLQKS